MSTCEGDDQVWPIRRLLNRGVADNLWLSPRDLQLPGAHQIRVLSVTNDLTIGESTAPEM